MQPTFFTDANGLIRLERPVSDCRTWTTDGTVPPHCLSLWKGWQAAWGRIRRMKPNDRELEMKSGFLVRSSSHPVLSVRLHLRAGPDQWFSADGVRVRIQGSRKEVLIPASCGFNQRKPYVRVQDLQDAAEHLAVSDVMSS